MRIAFPVRAVFVFFLPCLITYNVQGQRQDSDTSPLDGSNFIGVYVGGALSVASIDEGIVPSPNNSFSLSAPSGSGLEVGVSFSRLMPALFLSTSTTAEARLFYSSQATTSSGFGVVHGIGGSDQGRSVRQSTTSTITIAGLQSRLIFDTRKMAETTPTVSIGLTLGHIADIRYETEYTPPGIIENNENGLPSGSNATARRWFYAAAHIGGGGRISLGDPATSPAILPEAELIIPMTSFARTEQWIAFGIRAGIGLRWPL